MAEHKETKPVFKRSREELAALLTDPLPDSPAAIAALLAQLHGDGAVADMIEVVLRSAAQAAGVEDELRDVFLHIVSWALAALADDGPLAFPRAVAVWAPESGDRQVAHSAAQCRGLLANAALLNVADPCADLKPPRNRGGLGLARLYHSQFQPVAAQKLACLLHYFAASRGADGTAEDQREVVFERRTAEADPAAFTAWALEAGGDRPCDPSGGLCELHGAGMEAVEDADAFVNFANANFGYGHFIPSCTQEEIMQVCCPEFNVGMVYQGRMTDREVVVVHGAKRFCRYRGYADRFELEGPWEGPPLVQKILTMDATPVDHFLPHMVLRDVRKAYLSFRGCSLVSTGRWGCGVFGGLPTHKLAQQVVAAALAGAEIRFSTFGSADCCDELLELLRTYKPTAAELLRLLLAMGEEKEIPDSSARFVALLRARLRALRGEAPEASGAAGFLGSVARRLWGS